MFLCNCDNLYSFYILCFFIQVRIFRNIKFCIQDFCYAILAYSGVLLLPHGSLQAEAFTRNNMCLVRVFIAVDRNHDQEKLYKQKRLNMWPTVWRFSSLSSGWGRVPYWKTWCCEEAMCPISLPTNNRKWFGTLHMNMYETSNHSHSDILPSLRLYLLQQGRNS